MDAGSTPRRTLRAGSAYVVAVLLLTEYGGEVCPYLEQLTFWHLAWIHAGAFAIAFVARVFGTTWLRRAAVGDSASYQRMPWHQLWLDMTVWVIAGLLVTGWNTWNYEFPVLSGLKVLLGSVTLGIFASGYMALLAEADLLEAGLLGALARGGRFLSISRKFMAFFTAAVGVVCGIILLLVYKDFTYTIESLTTGVAFQFGAVVKEVLFVFAVLVAGTLLVAGRYGRNLRMMFDIQLDALGAVEQGDLERTVPVVTNDEFGLIADATNRMIAGLKDKERIERAFGKYLSPPVAQAVLESEQETRLGGRLVSATVLFTDLRGFTPLSERCSPEDMVGLLNEYFTMVVRAVHDSAGILDKFVGDAAMAVFGLDGQSDGCDSAFRAAVAIREGLIDLNVMLAGRGLPSLENGIGIHHGPVVAGNIGSEERLEYTVIGDAVNVASRLEGLTKELRTPLAVSLEVRDRLSRESQDRVAELGSWQLKGKSEPITVYGLSTESADPVDA